MVKKWYHSKVLWANAILIIALIVEANTGEVLTPEMQVAILGVVNIVLRLVTSQGIAK